MTGQINVNKIAARSGTTITVDTGDALDVTLVKAEGVATTNLKQGLAKVWCHFDGQTGSSNDTFNVSGMTDEGTGEHTIGISNDFSNASYSFSTGIAEGNTNDNIAILCAKQGAIAVGSITVYLFADDSGLFDSSSALDCCVTLHGDLA